MKRIFATTILLISSLWLSGQIPVGQWRDHYSYSRGLLTTWSSTRLYLASENGIFWHNPNQGTIGKISTVNGLSDVGISAIKYSPFGELLLVGYDNGNIDIVLNNQTVNLPYIYQHALQGSKRINDFYFLSQSRVLVSTGFGLVVINVDRFEIEDTYFIGPGGDQIWVNQALVFNGNMYAASQNGIYTADLNDPLLIHFDSWNLIEEIPHGIAEYSNLAVYKDGLVAHQSTGGGQLDALWYFDSFSWSQISNEFNQVRSIAANNDILVALSREGVATYQSVYSTPSIIDRYGTFFYFTPNWVTINNQGFLVIADDRQGLVYKTPNGWQRVHPTGPRSDRAHFIVPHNEDVLVASGGITDTWNNRFFPLSFHTFSKNQWETVSNTNYWDAVRMAPSPFHPNEYYIASWGHGVVVYRDGEEVANYDPANSSLESVIPGAYCRIGGIAFDKNNNLWVANPGVPNPISVRTPDGIWKSFPYQSLINSQRLSDIMLSPNGDLWTIIPSGGGFFVWNPGSNPLSENSHTVRSFRPTHADGSALPNQIYSMAFDRDGYLWVGTNEGVLLSYNPQRVFEPSGFSMQRILIPDVVEGLAVYLLESETVTSIAIDGANRKWFGTQRSGVFLQSADGSNQLKHFTKGNSPLPSNSITHIGIHPNTGEVFFATDKGLVSYRGEATEPSNQFGKVYAFPNPVRPEYSGPITITGLVDKTTVKITDVAGNLVFETESLGGQAIWDGTNRRGQRVSTGVYLYFCSDRNGEQSAVGKILFVR